MKSKLTRRGFLQGTMVASGATVVGAAAAAPIDAKQHYQVKVDFTLNSEPIQVTVGVDSSALEVVRKEGLTSCKSACAQGVCGACTIHVGGESVNSCLLPATSLEGRRVETLEKYKDNLHPLQKAFIAEDALQCGYCTPGFLMEGIEFCDKWRREHGDIAPSREAIAEAMSGHLCRCGAYEGIYKAVQQTCQGKFDDAPVVAVRADALPKVQGLAKYTADIHLPNMLHAVVLRSPYAHAKITRIDTSNAEDLPSVHAIVEYAIGGKIMRYAGQEILAVAASSRAAALAARDAIDIDFKVFPAVADQDAALKENAPLVYGKKSRSSANSAAEGMVFGARWNGNLRGPTRLDYFQKRKKAQKLIAQARKGESMLSQGLYEAHAQCHSALEPHGCVAHWRTNSELEVWLSCQGGSEIREEIAERWELKRENVRVYNHFVGGAFGAKATAQPELYLAIELAKKAKSPVKLILDRQEELVVGGFRPAAKVEIAVAANQERVRALTMKCLNNSGSAVGSNTSMQAMLLYKKAAKKLEDFDVLTHTAGGLPFRGPGAPAGLWAIEQSIDDLAFQQGVDPLVYRQKIDPHPARQRLYQWALRLPIWQNRPQKGPDKGRYLRGVGAAVAAWPYMAGTRVQLALQSRSDGGLIASSACQDMGNGSTSAVAWAIAQAMSMDRALIEVRFGDSQAPRGTSSVGSRTTASMVPVAEEAVRLFQLELFERGVIKYQLEQARIVERGIAHARGLMTWPELIAQLEEIQVVARRPRDVGGYMIRSQDFALGKANASALQIYQVEVDRQTGRIQVTDAVIGIAAGRIVSPPIAKSQAYGGMLQGISYALYEERRLDKKSARSLSLNLNDYRLLGMGDVPNMYVYFDEVPLEGLPPGAVCGISELVTVASAAALGNAVHHATGKRCKKLPLRPDRVLMELL